MRFLAPYRGATISRGANVSTYHFCSHGRAIQCLGPSNLSPGPLGLIGEACIPPLRFELWVNLSLSKSWPDDLVVAKIGGGPNIWPKCQVWRLGNHRPVKPLAPDLNPFAPTRMKTSPLGLTGPIRGPPAHHHPPSMTNIPSLSGKDKKPLDPDQGDGGSTTHIPSLINKHGD